ncbi:MAG: LysM peptidoglycan-binding domain-containing M23 family metallopeptidase [Anaerolineae bacterium]|nr:LysM peptidoglycan-binding domain-containing M23 family metallopeptidase [Anaerolineae bacterium]
MAVLLWSSLFIAAIAAPPFQDEQTVHVVQAGETLFGIAQQYGLTVDAIVAANSLVDPDRIEVGQQLVIPLAPSGVEATTTYRVQPGDTLSLIARQHSTMAEQIAQLNHLANPNLIYVGQALLIPTKASGMQRQPPASQVYVIRPGDTMAQIAARYNTTVWAIAQANNIVNPNVVYVGQRLLIPTGEGVAGTASASLPLPFLSVEIIPAVAVQGQTVQVIVETEGEASLDGSYGEYPLLFVGESGHYRTLIGIYAMATSGPYPLALKAVQDGQEVTVRSMLQVVEGSFGLQYLTFTGEKAELLDPLLVEQEAQRVWEITTQATLPQRWQGTFGLPLSGERSITTPFGTRRSYNAGPASGFHGGVDYAAPEDTPVNCPAAGRVVLAEALQVRGNVVIVDHGRGVMSGYWHLSQVNVVAGQEVARGDVLGWVGNTGLSTGAHLHWEMRVMGVQVDPLQWTRESIN